MERKHKTLQARGSERSFPPVHPDTITSLGSPTTMQTASSKCLARKGQAPKGGTAQKGKLCCPYFHEHTQAGDYVFLETLPCTAQSHSWGRATLQALLPPQVNKPEGQVSTAIYFTHKETPGGRWTSLLLRSELLTAETAIRKVNCFSEINLHVPASVPCPAIWCGLVLLNPSWIHSRTSHLKGSRIISLAMMEQHTAAARRNMSPTQIFCLSETGCTCI